MVEWLKQNKCKSGIKKGTNMPFITLSNKDNSHNIYFNSFLIKNILDHNKYINVGINDTKKHLYFKKTTVNDIDAIKLNISKNCGHLYLKRIVGRVIQAAGIKKGQKERYKVKKYDDNIYYADFKKPLNNIKGEIINEWKY